MLHKNSLKINLNLIFLWSTNITELQAEMCEWSG